MFSIIAKRIYQDDQVIYHEALRKADLYLVIEGTVELSRMFRGKKVIIENLKEGDLFGESDFMEQTKYSARATATARGKVILGLIDQQPLMREFNLQPENLKIMLSALMDRSNRLLEQTCQIASRANNRVSRFLAVSFPKADHTTVKAYASDIGSGGLFIQTDEFMKEGRQFRLNLHIPGLSEPLELKCEVIWIRNESTENIKTTGMGVKFLDIPEKDNQILQVYIKTIEQMKTESFAMSEKDTRILEEYLGMVEDDSTSD